MTPQPIMVREIPFSPAIPIQLGRVNLEFIRQFGEAGLFTSALQSPFSVTLGSINADQLYVFVPVSKLMDVP